MQHSLSEDHQHRKWQHAKIMDIISRLLACAGQAADAVSAYTQVNWRMHPNYWKIPNRNVQTFGFVYHDTNGLNHGPVWKTHSFLLSKTCTVILCQNCYVERQFQKNRIAARLGEGFQLGLLFRTPWKRIIRYLCMWMTSNWMERHKTMFRFEKYLMKKSIRKNPTSFFDLWNLGLCTHCGQLQNHVRIANFRGENWKTSTLLRFFVLLHGLWIWRVMQRYVWNDIVSFQTRRLNNSTQYQLHASMSTIPNKKKRIL